jgi:ribonuclease VapC
MPSAAVGLNSFLSRRNTPRSLARRIHGRRRHPARLNFGDCMVYGVAKGEGEALLFKGNDFTQTDIEPALKD